MTRAVVTSMIVKTNLLTSKNMEPFQRDSRLSVVISEYVTNTKMTVIKNQWAKYNSIANSL